MPAQYCFTISNPENYDYSETELKNYIENLYLDDNKEPIIIGKKNPKPLITAFVVKEENNVCIVVNSAGKKNIAFVEDRNKNFRKSQLKWKHGIILSKPTIFTEREGEFWKEEKWWAVGKHGEKWVSLIQNGPYFKDLLLPYNYLNSSLIYEGKKYPLSIKEEKVARLYAQRKISESTGNVALHTEDKVFNENFWDDFKDYLRPRYKNIFQNFYKIDWSDLMDKIIEEKENITSEDKLRKKINDLEIKRKYQYALLDGKKEKVGNFTIEQQSIFLGRGKSKIRGRIKSVITPDQVTINIGPGDPVPEAPGGYNWEKVVHDRKHVWLSSWKDPLTGARKYVYFSNESKFKALSDLYKFEIARKLNLHIDSVREKYSLDFSKQDPVRMQLGTVMYLIDNFGIRVGGEKKDDTADTFGASTLLTEHIELIEPNIISADFPGKDSIIFNQQLEVIPQIFNNFKILLRNKDPEDPVFDEINAGIINIYLKEFDRDFTAKVFRTRLANEIMYSAISEVKISEDDTKQIIKSKFNKANKKVAEALNHKKTVSKASKNALSKIKEKIKEEKKKLKEEKKEGNTKKVKKLEQKIAKLEQKVVSKKSLMDIAINTSLANYIDPRLIISWMKENNVEMKTIYTKALREKFIWAIDNTEQDWDWVESPLLYGSDLNPSEQDGSASVTPNKKGKYKKSKRKPDPFQLDYKEERKTGKRRTKKKKDEFSGINKDNPFVNRWGKKNLFKKDKRPFEFEEKKKLNISKETKRIQHNLKKQYQLFLDICLNPKKIRGSIEKIDKKVYEEFYNMIVKYSKKNKLTRKAQLFKAYYEKYIQ